mmetsp:Transcript_20469/g.62425  ORF Transcript_20469/g.62425 Transcript_20469/m.62425 type:complete len:120 (+) Transcript_20469:1044-1403(+)|eukprot:scaffold186218_cov30-Tisochrysis_lutea.AAC.2
MLDDQTQLPDIQAPAKILFGRTCRPLRLTLVKGAALDAGSVAFTSAVPRFAPDCRTGADLADLRAAGLPLAFEEAGLAGKAVAVAGAVVEFTVGTSEAGGATESEEGTEVNTVFTIRAA